MRGEGVRVAQLNPVLECQTTIGRNIADARRTLHEQSPKMASELVVSTEPTAAATTDPALVRVMMNGCFDLMHAGHYNAFRQSKFLDVGEGRRVHLVAVVHSDEAILHKKGSSPVFTLDERVALLNSCKWVDEVAVIDEYAVPLSFMDSVRCEFVTHGDDMPKISTGAGMYDAAIAAGRFRTPAGSSMPRLQPLLSTCKLHARSNQSRAKNAHFKGGDSGN